MKKILLSIYVGFASCVFFCANCSSASPVPELTQQNEMKAINIILEHELAETYAEANHLVKSMDRQEVLDLIQQEDRRIRKDEDLALAQQLQTKEDAEYMAQIMTKNDQEQMSQDEIRRIEEEENLKRQQEREMEEAATADFLQREAAGQADNPETLALIDVRGGGQPRIRGHAGAEDQRLINLCEYLEVLDRRYGRGFLQMFESGNFEDLADALAEYSPDEEPNAGNALNIILNF